VAVLGRVLIGSQERIDLADLLAVDSYTASDFKYLIKSFVGSTPMVLKGFEVIDAALAIGGTSVSLKVADSVLYYPESTAGSFFHGLPEGNALSTPLVPELRFGNVSTTVINYVYLTLTSQGQGLDSRAFWDVDLNGGEGGEFNQDVNTESVLISQVGVSVSGFPAGTVPVAKITCKAQIESITDCRNLMFRLGSGGNTPDIDNTFQFRNFPDASYARNETPITVTNSSAPNPFQGGDKNIYSMKEWMDAVMTKLLELSGTTFWYEASASMSVADIFADALGSSIKSKGRWSHDANTPGKVTWSEDIVYRKMNDPREVIVRQNPTTGITLVDDQVMWIQMVRDGKLNALNDSVDWFNAQAKVEGAVGAFANLSVGDWIKKRGDDDYAFRRVKAFWTGPGFAGSASAATAAVVELETTTHGNYPGSTGTAPGVYTKGEYQNSDIQVTTRASTAPFTAGGDLYWLANRSDTIQNIASIVATEFTTNVDITDSDGGLAKLQFPSAHGLVDGDRVVVSGAGAYNGTYQIEVEDTDTVVIQTAQTSNPTGVTVNWSIVTTGARNMVSGFQLESANHNFESNQTVIIAGTSSGYDSYLSGKYPINVRSTTTFQVPYNADTDLGAGGTATCARVNLRTEFGAARVIQGESIDINEPDTANIMSFVGMSSLSETHPEYQLPPGSNMLAGFEDFNSDPADSLTDRASRLTAMMADRVQDRGMLILGRRNFRNTTSGGNQEVTVYGGNLTIELPGSPQQIITMSSSYLLPANSAIVVDVARDSGTAVVPTIESLGSPYLLEENKIILFYRFGGTDVYDWNGEAIPNSGSKTTNDSETSQNRNVFIQDKAGVYYDGSTGVFAYNSTAEDVYINIPGSSVANTADTSAIMALSTGTRTIGANKAVWVRVNRYVAKVFTTITTSPTFQDTDAAGALYITDLDDVPTDQDVCVVYSTSGSDFLLHHHVSPHGLVYEETFEISGLSPNPSTGDVELTLPVDSREGGEGQFYIVGSGQLSIFLNGQRLEVGATRDYVENNTGLTFIVGDACNKIVIKRELENGDRVTFRIDSNGATYFTNLSASTTTLQQAYDNGNTITTTSGVPFTVGGTASKVAVFNGDIDVTGVIDPKGITFTPQVADPLAGSDYGLWTDDATKDLVYKRAGGAPQNLSNDFMKRDGSNAATANMNMGGYKITNADLAIPTAPSDIATKSYVDSVSTSTTSIARDGTQPPTADISWGSNKLTDLAAPATGTDAANKSYTDTQDGLRVAKAGDTMSGILAMGSNKITGLGSPTGPTDAATKSYIDEVAPPVGTIIAYNPGYYTGSNNTGFTVVGAGSNSPSSVDAYLLTLGGRWRVCDTTVSMAGGTGRPNDAASPIWNTTARYVPNLGNGRFLRGNTGAGAIGGTGGGTATLVPANIPTLSSTGTVSGGTGSESAHTHTINHDHPNTESTTQSANHRHYIAHSGVTSENPKLEFGGYERPIQATDTGSYPYALRYASTGAADVGRSGPETDNHTHDVNIPNYSGSSGTGTTHNHTISIGVTTTYTNASPTAVDIVPTYLNTVYIIRVK
jgi:hypothetical protein